MQETTQLFSVLDRVFLTVSPLVVIVLIGFLYARKVDSDMSVANRVNMDIFLPALIFAVMSSKEFDISTYATLAAGSFAMVIGSGLLIWPLCKTLGVAPKTFAPPMMFNNCGNLGLPLALLAFGDTGLAAFVAMFLVSNTLHFTLGKYLVNPNASFRNLLLNPIMLATVAGLIWSTFKIPVAEWAATPIAMLSEISIPLMLFSLGVRMKSVDLSNWKVGIYGAIFSPLTGLMIAIPFALLMDLSNEFTAYIILFSALPPAVLNFMFSERYNQDPQAVASIVLIGNIASLIFIPATLFFIL